MLTIVAHGRVITGTMREIEDELDLIEQQQRAQARREAKARRREQRGHGPLDLWAIFRRFFGI